ncbi:MAG: peptidylprolyl isomerase [Clostridia bacterium]|nr:peptidylprolyl isomerase [Clostridia bacterium]
MKKTIRIICFVLIAVLSISLCGCVNKNTWAVRYGEHTVSAGMFVYQLQQQKSNYLSSNSLTESNDIWNEEYDDEYTIGDYIQLLTLQSLVSNITWRAQFERLGLSFTEEEQANIDASIAELIENSGGEDYVRNALKENGIGYDEFVELVYYDTQKILKVVDYYFGAAGLEPVPEQEIKDYFADNYARCKHILISTQDSSGSTLTGNDMKDARAEAQSVYEMAKNADDAAFDALIKEYNDDEGVSTYPDGYVFTTGEMVDEFEKAAFDMDVGETRLVQSDYGYHVIRKLTLDDKNVFTEEIRKKMLMSLKNVEISELFSAWMDETPCDINQSVVRKYDCTSIGTVEESAISEEEQLAALAEQLGLEQSQQ